MAATVLSCWRALGTSEPQQACTRAATRVEMAATMLRGTTIKAPLTKREAKLRKRIFERSAGRSGRIAYSRRPTDSGRMLDVPVAPPVGRLLVPRETEDAVGLLRRVVGNKRESPFRFQALRLLLIPDHSRTIPAPFLQGGQPRSPRRGSRQY